MRLDALVVPGQFRKKSPFYTLGAVAVFFYLAYELAQYVLAGDLMGLAFLGLFLVILAFVVVILNDWRRGYYFFLGWLMFEDLFRKYLGNNMVIYFAKDVILAVVYLSFFLGRGRKQVQLFHPPFRLALLIFVWFGILQIFNPASTSVFFGLLGMKLYFYYVPLLFLGYSLIQSEADLRRFYPFLLLLTIIIASLGVAQAILGPTFLNPSNLQEDIRDLSTNYRVAPISGAIVYRPNSVFVSTGRFAFFLVPAWLFAFGFGVYAFLRTRQYRLLASLGLACTTAAIALCASRGTLLWSLGSALICIPAFLWGCPWQKGQLVRILRGFQRATVAAVVALMLTFVFYPEALMGRIAFYWETLDPSGASSELVHRTQTYPLQQLGYAFQYPRWPYGYGIGTASLGLQYISRILRVPPIGIGVESGFGDLVLELGIVGLFLYLILAASIVISAWRVVHRLKGTPWFPIGFVTFLYSGLFLFAYLWGGLQCFEDYILNSLLWFSLGILFRLPSLSVNPAPSGFAVRNSSIPRTA